MSAQDRPQEAIKFHKSYMVGALLSALLWTYLYFNNPFGETPSPIAMFCGIACTVIILWMGWVDRSKDRKSKL